MGLFVSLLTVLPDPEDTINDNPDLVVGSAWNTIFSSKLVRSTFLPIYVTFFSNGTSDLGINKYYIIPLTDLNYAQSVSISTNSITNILNTKLTAISVVESVNDYIINLFLKYQFIDYETFGSITPYGILTESFTQNQPNDLISQFPYFTKLSNVQSVTNDNVVITYNMMKNVLINRTITTNSIDVLDSLTNVLSNSDFIMSSESTNLSFRFFIKNQSKTNMITLTPGTGWSFTNVVIPARTCAAFYASTSGTLCCYSKSICVPP